MASTEVVHSAGRRLKNQVWNGHTAKPATLYLGLRQLDGVGGHTADAAAADTLTSNLNEVTTVGTGYARIPITFNDTNAPETASGADSILTFALETFTFAGNVNGITHAFLATSADNSGILVESAPLAAVRNVVSGDQINVTYGAKMVGA